MSTRYELVVVINPALTADQITALKTKIVDLVGEVIDTDDIGLLPLAYQMNGQVQAYFISRYVELDQARMQEISAELRITKGVSKFVFYKIDPKQGYLKFAELNKMFADIQQQEEDAKQERAAVAQKEQQAEEEAKEAKEAADADSETTDK